MASRTEKMQDILRAFEGSPDIIGAPSSVLTASSSPPCYPARSMRNWFQA